MINIKFNSANKSASQQIQAIIVKSESENIFTTKDKIEFHVKNTDLLSSVKIGKYLKSFSDKLNKQNLVTEISLDLSGLDQNEVLAIVEGIMVGSWKYKDHKTVDTNNHSTELNIIFTNDNNIKQKIDEIRNIIEASYLTRTLVETPSNLLNPSKLAEIAQSIPGLEVTIEKPKHGGIWEVGKGSSEEPLLITCEWKGKTNDCVALVGKGVTFDSGGLSLKPPKSMEDMKIDMAGAATVLGVLQAAASNNIDQRIVGIIPCVENMPSGNALKPGDVITTMSGQTVEVLNTDAEGRLILADALHIAQTKFSPKYMVNFATLTGAIHVALGEVFAGLFSNNDKLSQEIVKFGNIYNEPSVRLPLHQKYDALINSDIADMCNIQKPGGGAGSITAAQFLQRFILQSNSNNVTNHDLESNSSKTNNNPNITSENSQSSSDKTYTPWAHMDIASVARTTFDSILGINGSTGFAVRFMYHMINSNN